MIFFFYILKLLINNISNYFLKNSIAEVEQITSALINYSVTDDMLTDLELDNLYRITKNSDNEVEMIDYNPVAVNKFLNKVTNSIQDGLFKMEKGDLTIIGKGFNDDGTIFYIPFGSITSNPILCLVLSYFLSGFPSPTIAYMYFLLYFYKFFLKTFSFITISLSLTFYYYYSLPFIALYLKTFWQ